MKHFRYLFFLEIFIIASIFIFFGDKESNQTLYDFVNLYVSEHKWAVSTKYYEASKITSVFITLFIILNNIYLMIWILLNYNKPTEDYNFSTFYKSDFKVLLALIINLAVLFLFYYGDPIDLANSNDRFVPTDGLWGILFINIAMLVAMTACGLSIFVLVSNAIYRVYTLFK